MKTLTKVLLVIAAVMITGAIAVGCHGPHHKSPDKKADWVVKKITSELDLDDEQAETLNGIKEEVMIKFKEESVNRDKKRLEMISLIKSDSINANDINDLLDKREERMKELKPFIVEKIVEFHTMLTPEQREKLAEFIEEHHSKCDFD